MGGRGKKPQKKAEETHLGWKMQSPDEVLAERNAGPEWSTPDGKPPTEGRCKVNRCPNFTIRQPPVCGEHFYGMTRNVRDKLVIKKAEEARSNGR